MLQDMYDAIWLNGFWKGIVVATPTSRQMSCLRTWHSFRNTRNAADRRRRKQRACVA
jgi:hypothetical protein